MQDDDTIATIPLHAETVTISTREVDGASKRVHISVSEHDERVEAMLLNQHVSIERRPVGRDIEASPGVRQDGDTIIIPILAERVVTRTQLVLVEEIHLRIDQTHEAASETVRLRREHAEIAGDTVDVTTAPKDIP